MVVPSDAKGIMEQPVTPRPCFNQPKLAVVEKARARLLHSFKEPRARTPLPPNPHNPWSKSDPDSAPGTDPAPAWPMLKMS